MTDTNDLRVKLAEHWNLDDCDEIIAVVKPFIEQHVAELRVELDIEKKLHAKASEQVGAVVAVSANKHNYKADLLARLEDLRYAVSYLSAAARESQETFFLALRDVAEAQKGIRTNSSMTDTNDLRAKLRQFFVDRGMLKMTSNSIFWPLAKFIEQHVADYRDANMAIAAVAVERDQTIARLREAGALVVSLHLLDVKADGYGAKLDNAIEPLRALIAETAPAEETKP